MKVAVFEVEPWEREYFESLQDEHDVVFREDRLTAQNAGDFQDAEVISTFIYSDMDEEVLAKMESLKMIATRSTGFDHIAMDYCKEDDIAVSNVPDYGDNTVAEHAFGLLLCLSKHFPDAVNRTRRGDFSQEALRGFDLKGKTIGVIGVGNIGRHAVQIAKGFGMEVLANDIKKDEEFARKMDFRYVELDELLAEADVITLHLPGSAKTKNLLGEEEFAKMKDGVVIINTSRGLIIDSDALVRGLSEKRIAGAGLDVLPQEPVIREEAELLRTAFDEAQKERQRKVLVDHILLRLTNVYVTPHSAYNTREAVARILKTTTRNIETYIAGEAENCVSC